ncbi:MAG TPA: protein-L-isoaspartate O-methyltransferase [Afifellaceae bacterium]|nr:protein-L-isoaspartate O-methyltransferase [Afifellaceae bacterium]
MDCAALRQRMVDNQLRPRDITDHRVIRAFLQVPREIFLAPAERPLAYADRDVPVAGGARHLISPAVQARLVQALELGPDDVVLNVACGTGYTAAILAQLAGSVVAVEDDEALVRAAEQNLSDLGIDNVAVVKGELSKGCPAEAPFGAILLGAGVEILPETLPRQLDDGGRLATILVNGPAGRAMLYERAGEDVSGRPIFDATAPVLPGFRKAPQFVF